MVNAIFKKENDNMIISINGHANFDTHGSDIVCSAISILIHTLHREMLNLEMEDKHNSNGLLLEDGKFYVELLNYKECIETMQAIRTIRTGLILLENEYPNYITVIL